MSFDSDPVLRSPWWVAEDLDWADCVMVRGMRVNDDIPLTALVNVGGMRLFPNEDPKKDRVKWIGLTPAGRLALKCLDGSPFDGEVCGEPPTRPWKKCPDSSYHRRHVAYLQGVAALGVPAYIVHCVSSFLLRWRPRLRFLFVQTVGDENFGSSTRG